MPAAHDLDNASRSVRCLDSAMYVAPVAAAQVHILRDRPDVVAARNSRKRCDLARLIERHGTAKREWVAEALEHRSTRRVQRCLSERERDEFSADDRCALGIDDESFAVWRAAIAGAEARAA